MVYREPPSAHEPQPPPDAARLAAAARLATELAGARARARRLLQATGLASIFVYLKIHPFGWIPSGVVLCGYSLWAALFIVSGASLFESWRIARELRRAQAASGCPPIRDG